ncbi:hypothetical protein AB0M12_15310 [Nocardia vinacea]|uniref:hypothetical protein n=1 Tax=Nocardia vinacea TaxID=96468 RepID=UPI003444FF8C
MTAAMITTSLGSAVFGGISALQDALSYNRSRVAPTVADSADAGCSNPIRYVPGSVSSVMPTASLRGRRRACP